MKLSEIREYSNWIGKSPAYIRDNVIRLGGWKIVFPIQMDLPFWVHRIRNFFNEAPTELFKLGESQGREATAKTRKGQF